MALPETLEDFGHIIHFVLCFFSCPLSVWAENVVWQSLLLHVQVTYKQQGFYWQLFCKPHGPWNTIPPETWDPPPLLTQKCVGPPEITVLVNEKKKNYLLLSHSIRLQIRKMAENIGCISHVIGNKPAVLGSVSFTRHKEAARMASAKYRQSRTPLIPPPLLPRIIQKQQLRQCNSAVYQIRCIQPPAWYCNNLKLPLCKTFTQNELKY